MNGIQFFFLKETFNFYFGLYDFSSTGIIKKNKVKLLSFEL